MIFTLYKADITFLCSNNCQTPENSKDCLSESGHDLAAAAIVAWNKQAKSKADKEW